jgi:tRNA(fMet)-specific endonuclease VapC
VEVISLCLDTNAYSAHQRGDAFAVQLMAAVDELWIPAVVLGELRSGFLKGNKGASNELHLQRFLQLDCVSVAPVSEVTSRHYAEIFQQLRHDGQPIPVNDIWIAAAGLELNCPVFTFDKHFHFVKGLNVVNQESDWMKIHSGNK